MNKLLILLLTTILSAQLYDLNTFTYSRITYTIGDTITFKVKGLVCSFCAHGLNKGIGKMDYTDENNVFVDINKQTVKVVILKEPDIEKTIKVITDSGYEVSEITHANKMIWKEEK